MNSNTVNSFFKVATSNHYISTGGLLSALALLLFAFFLPNQSFAYNLSTATTQKIGTELDNNDGRGIYMKADGSAFYNVEIGGDDIEQYNLSIPWSVATSSVTFYGSTNSAGLNPSDVTFKPDGTKMFVADGTGNTLYQYTLSTPWDITSASYDSISYVTPITTTWFIDLNDDGTKIFYGDSTLCSATLATPYSLSSVSGHTCSGTSLGTTVTDIYWRPDGLVLYALVQSSDAIRSWTSATPFSLSLTTTGVSISSPFSVPQGLSFRYYDGVKMFTGESDYIIEYNLTTDYTTGDIVSGSSGTDTRIIDTWPKNDGTIYSSGQLSYASTSWYVNSDDVCTVLCSTKFEYTYQHINSDGTLDELRTFTSPSLTTFDSITYGAVPLSYISELGTYTVGIRIYNDRPLGFLDFDITPSFTTSFIIATRTAPDLSLIDRNESIIQQAFAGITCEFSFPFLSVADATCLAQYLLAIFVPSKEVLMPELTKTMNAFMYAAPWGYVTWLNTSLLNPAVTSTSSTQLTFAPQNGMPGYGASLTLNVADGVSLFESTLSGTSTSFAGTYFEQFSFYWNLIWYLAFGFWLLWNLLGLVGPDVSNPTPYENRQSGLAKTKTLNLQPRGTLDLRKKL